MWAITRTEVGAGVKYVGATRNGAVPQFRGGFAGSRRQQAARHVRACTARGPVFVLAAVARGCQPFTA
jgi:hypothetical protein